MAGVCVAAGIHNKFDNRPYCRRSDTRITTHIIAFGVFGHRFSANNTFKRSTSTQILVHSDGSWHLWTANAHMSFRHERNGCANSLTWPHSMIEFRLQLFDSIRYATNGFRCQSVTCSPQKRLLACNMWIVNCEGIIDSSYTYIDIDLDEFFNFAGERQAQDWLDWVHMQIIFGVSWYMYVVWDEKTTA